MIRLLLLALLFYVGYRFISSLLRVLPGRPTATRAKSNGRGEEMVRDPQCGTYLPRGDALEKSVRGERHFFCSRECRDAFVGKE